MGMRQPSVAGWIIRSEIIESMPFNDLNGCCHALWRFFSHRRHFSGVRNGSRQLASYASPEYAFRLQRLPAILPADTDPTASSHYLAQSVCCASSVRCKEDWNIFSATSFDVSGRLLPDGANDKAG